MPAAWHSSTQSAKRRWKFRGLVLAWAGGPLGLGPWPLLAYLPALAKNLVGIVRVRLPLNLIRIGLTEVGLAFLYAVGLYLGLAA